MSTTNPFEAPNKGGYSPSIPAPDGIAEILFSFEGRINRLTYWTGSFGIVFAYMAAIIVLVVLGLPEDLASIVSLVLYLPLGWASLALNVKRWHDRDKSGWWVLIGFVPLIGGIWQFIECGCMEGTHGPNEYGADPIARGYR